MAAKPLLNWFRQILPKSFQMKNYPIHENLDTSFINLSALVKYLRRKRFAGSIRIELGDYEAEIILSDEDDLIVREHDRVSGRVGEGDEALQRLLIRARQPGGIINVYRHLTESFPVFENNGKTAEENIISVEPEQTILQVEEKSFDQPADSATQILSKSDAVSPDFPLKFSNNVETRARQNNLAPQDWQMLMDLTGELLRAIDQSLAEAGLNFKTAFQKASAEIAKDYPFLHREKGIIDYGQGKITLNEQISATIFVAGIMETLRRIMEKLGANPKFSEIYRQTVQEILALIRQRQPLYDKFSITTPLEKIIGA